MLNATDRSAGRRSVQKEINFKKLKVPAHITATDIEKALISAYPKIGDLLYTGVGYDLQYLDSQIAEKVLTTFTAAGKGIVGIHDGFRVAQEDLDTLVCAMGDGHREVVGFEGRVSIK